MNFHIVITIINIYHKKSETRRSICTGRLEANIMLQVECIPPSIGGLEFEPTLQRVAINNFFHFEETWNMISQRILFNLQQFVDCL